MGRVVVPNSASLHTARAFLKGVDAFDGARSAELVFDPRWAHMEPFALATLSAWGAWLRSQSIPLTVVNAGPHLRYAARMRLFEHLGFDYRTSQVEHEEAGRFLPVTQVTERSAVAGVIADISALLHLDDDPDSLTAVQFCVSELLRNVLEHASAAEGAFVCAQRFPNLPYPRVSIAVADCGVGVRTHLARAHGEAATDDTKAIQLALRPGVTGALPGIYGTPENAGAGLFLTRSIAKGTGGYFLIASGQAAYRQYRTNSPQGQTKLFVDPALERHGLWTIPNWQGTVVAVEVRTDRIADFDGFFSWIRSQIPQRQSTRRKLRFTHDAKS
jgi:hypothetical protein